MLIAVITYRPTFTLLFVGLINVPLCYWMAFWGLDWRIGLTALALLAFGAGCGTPAKASQVVAVLLVPMLFVGGPRHGRPWQWLVAGLMYPPLLIDFLFNMGPVIAAYALIVSAGHWLRHEAVKAALPRER
jgi:hypothetical protein